ncbi:MAG TPA: TrmO family methyltransferase, partial [Paracoccus sp. (in: a-proteobacteria)]|nr:TrmO family methyltransferase [Paracoccus sp. (in: a-proteobacteria)]
WPRVGIFAQRAPQRPNRIGVTICEIVAVEGRNLIVRALDAADGSPVLDIKPVWQELQPRTPIRQPEWVGRMARDYW